MDGFHTFRIGAQGDPFTALPADVDFDDVTSGRRGHHLVDPGDLGVPIVRTTTQYTTPAYCFSPAHRALADAVGTRALEHLEPGHPELAFNNALIEIYERTYAKMGFHSDQVLDLASGSFIALYSCYERPESRDLLRTLKVKNKTTGASEAIVLEHDSVVLFSLETNTHHAHKIVLDPQPSPKTPENRWLGVTLRCSKTFVRFEDGQPLLSGGSPLRLADEDERRAFYRLRGQENRSLEFTYPPLDYTISVADTLPPRDAEP